MTSLTSSIRPATTDDAGLLAELIDLAGEGLPSYLWAAIAEPGESVWDVGARRAKRQEGGFSYRNAWVIEADGKVAGSLIGYPLSKAPEAIGPDTPAMFVPLLELENIAAGSWYINVVAVFPGLQGRGLGSRLLEVAEDRALSQGCRQTSLIVFDRNEGARGLYERHGYRVIARRPIVKENWRCESDESLLMVKNLAVTDFDRTS